jgi:hypothetical protein
MADTQQQMGDQADILQYQGHTHRDMKAMRLSLCVNNKHFKW